MTNVTADTEHPEHQEMTIEELSQLAGVATTTVRMYQSRGLLPAPRRVGRVGHYGSGHLARLHLIGRLQERGFSLAAIQHLVETWEAGKGLDDVLGLEGHLPGLEAEAAPEPVVLTRSELEARFPSGAMTAVTLERAEAMGLVTAVDGDALEVQPRFLEVGGALAAVGLPLDEILDEQEALDNAMDAVALRFGRLFERHLWQDFVAEGMPAERLDELTQLLQRLTELATVVVQDSLHGALRRATEQFVLEEAGRLGS